MKFWYPPILAYHRIAPQEASDTPTLSPSIFEKQMMILAHRWKPVSLDFIVERFDQKRPFDRRAVAVTFDDGTVDNFTCAFPILLKYKIQATIFMITDNIGKSGFLTADQIREMIQAGIHFGSHTQHHTYLPSVPLDRVRQELEGSKNSLEKLGASVTTMSYPAGGFSEQIVRLVQESNYRAACTTNRGFVRRPIDRWALRRITMHAKGTTSLGMFIRCSGYYGLNRRLRSPA